MDSLQDILGQKDFTPPGEIAAVKDYVKRRYDSICSVRFQRGAIIVSVPSPTLAATIYLERRSLVEQCGLKQRLVVRSGH